MSSVSSLTDHLVLATIEIASSSGSSNATKTVIFHGAIASIVATTVKPVIGASATVSHCNCLLDIVVKLTQTGVLFANSGTATVRCISCLNIAGASQLVWLHSDQYCLVAGTTSDYSC
jgi:hypothetical protein